MSIEAKNLSVTINDKVILEGINATIPNGKITSVIGPNGAGKSTLLKAVAGINSNYGGQVIIDGIDLKKIKRKELARKLAVLPQGMQAPPDVTVEQLVDYGRFPYRSWFKKSNQIEDEEAVEWAMSETNVSHLRHRQVMSLSGGERQRAWIAMALAQKPEILILDEPTTYLDIAHQLEVMNLIESINREYGMTVIMVLHDINHALQYADELVVIKEGRLFAQGSPDEILTVDLIRNVFGVRADIFKNSQGAAVLSPVELVRE